MVRNIVQKVGREEFYNIIKNEKKIVIADFFAEWCMPCNIMAPIFSSCAEKNKHFKFIKVNVDEEGELAQEFGVSSIPCLIIFKNNNEADRVIGAVDEKTLIERLKRI
jgi:thioredoxin 1